MVSESSLYSGALLAMHLTSLFNILVLPFSATPYGNRSDGRPTIPTSLAWFLMESPTLWLTVLVYPSGRHSSHPFALFTISLFLLHYIHRTLIYPFRLNLTQKKNKRPSGFPLHVALIAFVFNLLNAYLQARSVSHYAQYPTGVWVWVRMLVGLGIFLLGMVVNIRSDMALVKLKGEGGGYKIPRGGWFEVVCCPNYMGEAVEWLGWAVLAWSPAAFGFFLLTCSNLVPRAKAHLRWYREKFGDEYPRSMKAIVPFIY